MKIVKISCKEETDTYIVVDSDNMQDVMFAVERFYQERRTPKITGDNPKLTDPLLFSVYGDSQFHGYGTDDVNILFKAEIVTPRFYNSKSCTLN